uniref:phosphoglycolate phosphatase n=1 Tax=Vitis vinifera TaxID=29760 RepID=F6HCV4_VITVI
MERCHERESIFPRALSAQGNLETLARSATMNANGEAAKAVPELLSPQNARLLLDSTEAFLFDCDGVIWKGDKLIDGVSETLDLLRSKGKKLVFVTNNSSKSRRQYAEKFNSLGIAVSEDEIFSSSFAAAMFLKVNDFPQEKKVYVIGGEGILEELQLAGFTGLGGPEDGKKTVELKSNCFFEHDKSVGAVVVGIDPYINYYKLQYGTLCIRENPGCLFIATNLDAVGHMTDLQEWPGAGCMVGAISSSTEKKPMVVGKPSTFMMDFLLQKYHINTSKMCMVGDRLDTDILFGQNAGCKTLLVLSGVTTQAILQDPSNKIQPDYYTSKLSDFLRIL